MKQIFFRLMVVFVGQLCCLLIGVFTGVLNNNDLRSYARVDRIAVLELSHSASQIVSDPPPIEGQAVAAEVMRSVNALGSPSLSMPLLETNLAFRRTGSAVAQRAFR